MIKRIKQLAVFLLASVMLFSVTACGSKAPETMFEAMRRSLEFKTYYLEMDITMEADDETVIVEAAGDVDRDAQACSLDLYVKYSGIGMDIGTVTMKDGILYLDMTELFDSMDLDEAFLADMFDSMGINSDDLESFTVYGLEIGKTEADTKEASDALAEHMISALEQGAAQDKYAVSGKDGSWVMELDNDNLGDVCSGILTYANENLDDIWENILILLEASADSPLSQKLEEMAADNPELDAELTGTEEILENADDYKNDLANALRDALDTAENPDNALAQTDCRMEIDYRYSGKKGSRVCEMSVSAAEENSDFQMEYNISMKEGSVSIEAPDTYTDAFDLLSVLSDLAGSSAYIPDESEIQPNNNGSGTENLSGTETVLTDHGELVTEDGTVVSVWPGDGFTYDSENSDHQCVFLDYDNEYYTYAFLYLYDMGGTSLYRPEDYYQDEIEARLANADAYPNAQATEFTSTVVNGYTVWYSVFSYEDDGDTHMELYSFSDLNTANLAVSAELSAYDEKEWSATMNGDVNAILESLWNGMFVE